MRSQEKVKIFRDRSLARIERTVNSWLSEADVEVTRAVQSEATDTLTLTVMYREKPGGEALSSLLNLHEQNQIIPR